MTKNYPGLLLMLFIVPLAGELKFFPFDGDFSSFRVSFGSPAFLFFLLWLRHLPFFISGLLAGSAVLIFRIVWDLSILHAGLIESFYLHLPAFAYYLVYALLFQLGRAKEAYDRPLRIGALAILAESCASLAELLLSLSHSNDATSFTAPVIGEVFLLAFIRSFFVLSFFFIMELRHAELVTDQQREQNKHMTLVISGLYEEVIQLSKTMQNAEDITRDCYNLYRQLQNSNTLFNKNQFAQNLLEIAGQVHEIKKDNQRIYASLSQLISEGKLNDHLPATELGELIIQSQQKYARSIGKIISFKLSIDDALPDLHVYTTLSLVNNLVANAVEAIADVGCVSVSFHRNCDYLEFCVSDSGPGIPVKKEALIFRPGYTTKFDASGTPSTGMGLPYIKDLAASLGGEIRIASPPEGRGVTFTISLPLKSLTKEEV